VSVVASGSKWRRHRPLSLWLGHFRERSLVIVGGAWKLAAATLRERLQAVASQILEAAASDIEISDGRVFVRGTDLGVEMRQLARAAYHQSHRFPAIAETGLSTVAIYDPYGTFSNACHVAIVAVDIATGQVEIERFVVVEDAGRLINPMIVEGQIHGGVAQGIANALYEKVVYDDGGNISTGSLLSRPDDGRNPEARNPSSGDLSCSVILGSTKSRRSAFIRQRVGLVSPQ
jgi:carbon-monoxide dehydrogenase large subunit